MCVCVCLLLHSMYSHVCIFMCYFVGVYRRQSFDPNAPGLASLQWDSAELLQIGAKEQMSYDDAFTIEEVAISAYDHMNSCT